MSYAWLLIRVHGSIVWLYDALGISVVYAAGALLPERFHGLLGFGDRLSSCSGGYSPLYAEYLAGFCRG